MAKSNKVSMPSGMGGITRYFDDYTSNLVFKPGHVILMCVVVMVIIILLHLQGGSLLGLS